MRSILVPALLATCILCPQPTPAVEWLPDSNPGEPRARADWTEPRMGLTWHHNSLHAALGAPLPLLAGGEESSWRMSLEGLALLGLSRDGSFFPLETVDGFFGGSFTVDSLPWRAKLRVVHWSAHKADGDTTVSYRDQTFSREWLSLEGGRHFDQWYVYARLGAAWHAVPESEGLKTALGVQWEPATRGPFLFSHLALEQASSFRLDQSHFVGWAWKASRPCYLGIRYHRGFRPRGQYLTRRTDFLGFELQIQP